MKKWIGSLIAGGVLVIATSAMAIPYTNTMNLNTVFKAPTDAGTTGVFTWSHAVTTDFQNPYDTVNSASLVITSQRAADGNDIVSIIDFTPTLGPLIANGNSAFLTTFDLNSLGVFSATWASGQSLSLSLAYNIAEGNPNSTSLTLVSSVFNLDYNNVSNDPPPTAAPVPEPSTILLLGAGLFGVGFLRRRTNK